MAADCCVVGLVEIVVVCLVALVVGIVAVVVCLGALVLVESLGRSGAAVLFSAGWSTEAVKVNIRVTYCHGSIPVCLQ